MAVLLEFLIQHILSQRLVTCLALAQTQKLQFVFPLTGDPLRDHTVDAQLTMFLPINIYTVP